MMSPVLGVGCRPCQTGQNDGLHPLKGADIQLTVADSSANMRVCDRITGNVVLSNA